MGESGDFQQLFRLRNCKKKLIESIARWVEGDSSDSKKSSWTFEGDNVRTIPASAIFQMWNHYRKTGEWPESGGWANQPLDVLVQIGAMQTVYDTYTYKKQKDADWSKFSGTQLEIIRSLESGQH